MVYLSDLMGRPIVDLDGDRVGHLEDLIASTLSEMPHPMIVALVIKRPADYS